MKIFSGKFVATFLLLLLLFAGCEGSFGNPNVNEIDRQIDKVSDHIYSISQNETYHNEDIDFTLLDRSKQTAQSSLHNLIASYEAGDTDLETLNENIDKTATLLYFVWMEEFDAAWNYKNTNNMLKVQSQMAEFNSWQYVDEWLKNNEMQNDLLSLQETMTALIRASNLSTEIDNNIKKLEQQKEKIDQLAESDQNDSYNKLVVEYNNLIDTNQSLIEEYNQIVSEYTPEDTYQMFLKIIDVKTIFPNQEELPLNPVM